MSYLRNVARTLFGRSIEVLDLKVAFHKEANLYGTHGHLIATHLEQRLKNAPVRFVFIGMSEPPAMTPRILEYIWEEARAQGYIPHTLASYGEVLATHAEATSDDIVSAERRQEEGVHYALPRGERELHVVGAPGAQYGLKEARESRAIGSAVAIAEHECALEATARLAQDLAGKSPLRRSVGVTQS